MFTEKCHMGLVWWQEFQLSQKLRLGDQKFKASLGNLTETLSKNKE